MKKYCTKYYYISREWFVSLNTTFQLIVVFAISFFVIFFSSIILGSMKKSYTIFVSPPELLIRSLPPLELFISFILMISGLVMMAFIISVISSSMENILRNIRIGKLKYMGLDHTIIINHNHLIFDLLKEKNSFYSYEKIVHDVVIVTDKHNEIEFLRENIRRRAFSYLNVSVRYSDLFSIERYKELSLLEVNSIIILRDYSIEDSFSRDNQNLKIVNLLYSDPEFQLVMKKRRTELNPIKALALFSHNEHFEKIIATTTHSNFLAVAPKDILKHILHLSVINIDFYNIWIKLLSFESHEIYFIDPKEFKLIGREYKELILSQENGLLIGLSRLVNSKFEILLNPMRLTIKEGDWLIVMTQEKKTLSFSEKYTKYANKHTIAQPKEVYTRKILILGKEREFEKNNFLDMKGSTIVSLNPDREELFGKNYFEQWIEDFDSIIFNLNDEITFRIAHIIGLNCSHINHNKFIFLINDQLIMQQLKNLNFKNIISPDTLFSRYISQISHQITLNSIFKILFILEGADINLIHISELDAILLENIHLLKSELAHNNITFLGTVSKEGEICFEATNLINMEKIIVLSDGTF